MASATDFQEDEVVQRMPVYLSKGLGEHLQVLQYPVKTRPYGREALPTGARLKPKSQILELAIPLNTSPAIYDHDRGVELSLGTTDRQVQTVLDQDDRMGSRAAAGTEEIMREIKLRGQSVPLNMNYAVGLVRDGALHIAPVKAIHQMRPSYDYLDRIDEKHRAAQRRVQERDASAAGMEDGQGRAGPEPKNRAIHVQVKSSAEAEAAAAARDTSQAHWARIQEEEAWSRLAYYDVESEASAVVFEAFIAKDTEALRCETSKEEFILDLASADEVVPK